MSQISQTASLPTATVSLVSRLARGDAYMEALGWIQDRQRIETAHDIDPAESCRQRARLINDLPEIRKHLARHGAVSVLVMFEWMAGAEVLHGDRVVELASKMADDVELQLSLIRSRS
jgi:hypothetical protein